MCETLVYINFVHYIVHSCTVVILMAAWILLRVDPS